MESLINVWADLKLRLRRVIGVDCWHIEQYRLLLIVIDIFQYVFVKFGFNFDQLKKNYYNFSKGVLFCTPSPPSPPPRPLVVVFLFWIFVKQYAQKQPWEPAAAFGNAVVNAVLCWFFDGKKNAVVKVFIYAVFLFRFYSVVDNSWKI